MGCDWYDPGFCPQADQTGCASQDEMNKYCILWGVNWIWLILAAIVGVIAVYAVVLVKLILALVVYTSRAYNREKWGTLLRDHTLVWTTWLLRVGLIWCVFLMLHFPNNVYNVFRIILSIMFFTVLIFWTNCFMNVVGDILQDYLETRAEEKYESEVDSVEVGFLPIGSSELAIEYDETEFQTKASRAKLQRASVASAGVESVRLLKYILVLLIAILGLNSIGVDVISFLQKTVVITLPIIFALQPLMRNIVGGLMVFFDAKYLVCDHIKTVGIEGTVQSIDLRSTILLRPDNSLVYVPNARVMEQSVVNLSHRKKRLLEVRIQLSRSTAVEKIRELIRMMEHKLRSLHPMLTSHTSNKLYQESGNDSFFVVLDSMFEVLVWTYTTLSDDRQGETFHRVLESEVVLTISETMEALQIKPVTDYEVSYRQDIHTSQPSSYLYDANQTSINPDGGEYFEDRYFASETTSSTDVTNAIVLAAIVSTGATNPSLI